MNTTITVPPTDEALERFLPLVRVRALCFVSHSRQDELLADYRRAAFDDGQQEARASFLEQTIVATFRSPYLASKSFGLELKVVDPDAVQGAIRLSRGPVISVTGIRFLDSGGADMEEVSTGDYAMEAGKFLRWGKVFEWPSERPTFSITYKAGFPPDSPKLASLRVAVGELIAAKWDAQGGSYAMPTTAKRAFHALRGSRTYLPG